MPKQIAFLLAILLPFAVHSQGTRMPVGAIYTKLVAYSSQFRDAFSFNTNLGALGAKQTFSAGLYSEKRFMLSELGLYSAVVVVPTASGNFGFKGDFFGGAPYRETALGLAYGRQVGDKAAVGLQFNYLSVRAAGYGSANSLNFSLGALFHLTPQLSAGWQVSNPIKTYWGKEGEENWPAIYAVGFGYDVSEQVFVGLEVEKTEDLPVSLNAGFEYAFAERLVARAGVRSATSVYYLGFGAKLKNFRLDVTANVHPYLGVTPGLLLLYGSKK